MKLPRDTSGDELAKRLGRLGYTVTRQTGSHLRLTRDSAEGEHHITIPRHDSLRVGTLSSVVKDVAEHFRTSKEELIQQLGE